MKSLLIVESQNDKAFVEALIDYLQLPAIDTDYIEKVEVETLETFVGEDNKKYNGLSLTSLMRKLEVIRNRLDDQYPTLERIGIITDADEVGLAYRLNECNQAINQVFGADNLLEMEGELKSYTFSYQNQAISLSFAYFCMKNQEGKGELSSVLRQIKKGDSEYADCLETQWQPCYQQKNIPENKALSSNQFDKFWLEVYLKYDQTQRSKRNKNSANISLIMTGRDKKGDMIFDFSHNLLASFTAFLKLFSS